MEGEGRSGQGRGGLRKRLKTAHPETEDEVVSNDDGNVVQLNPLLIHLVLEKVFPYSRCLDPNFKNYRLVCKLWDKEVLKLLRPDTEINLSRVVASHPEGLGWCAEEQETEGYQAPYPFENVEVNGTCEYLQDPQMIAWFESMGSHVKQLKFTSGLKCYHHVRFLECVLKKWCPNLVKLSLHGVDCFYTLINRSKFVDPGNIICTHLKQVTLSVDARDSRDHFQFCEADLPENYLNSDSLDLTKVNCPYPNHSKASITLLGGRFTVFIFSTPLLENYLFGGGGGPLDWTTQLRPMVQQAEREVLPNTDGGVLGQLLRSAPLLERLNIRKLSGEQIRRELIPFLYCRPNNMRKSLAHLSLEDIYCSHGNAMDNSRMGVIFALRMLRIMRYPLVSLTIGPPSFQTVSLELHDFLESFFETLEHLEILAMGVRWSGRDIRLNLPQLPKLKTILIEEAHVYQLPGFHILNGMPKLERCELLVHDTFPPYERQMTRRMFTESEFGEESHGLKELHMRLSISEVSQVKKLVKWFPQLVKVDLMIDGGPAFKSFLRLSNDLALLEDVKVSFSLFRYPYPVDCTNAIVKNMRKKTSLKFLELDHVADWPAQFPEKVFKLGFAKAPKLTSLKLTNIKIPVDIGRLRDCLSPISCVKMFNVRFGWKEAIKEVEFSVGRSTFVK